MCQYSRMTTYKNSYSVERYSCTYKALPGEKYCKRHLKLIQKENNMTIPGETVATGASKTCEDCSSNPTLGVYSSAAGWYIGYMCPKCGPYSRESNYYKTYKDAEKALESGNYIRL